MENQALDTQTSGSDDIPGKNDPARILLKVPEQIGLVHRDVSGRTARVGRGIQKEILASAERGGAGA